MSEFIALIDAWANLIESHGITLIVAILLGIALWLAMKRFSQHSDETETERRQMTDSQGEILQNTLQTIQNQTQEMNRAMLDMLKDAQEVKKTAPHPETRSEQSLKLKSAMAVQVPGVLRLQKLMRGLIQSTGGDRAYCYFFHNGGVTALGVPFIAMTCLAEDIRVGVNRGLVSQNRRLPVSIVPSIAKAVIAKEIMLIENTGISPIPEAPMLQDMGVRSLLIAGVYDEEDTPVGYIGIDFVMHFINADTEFLQTANDELNKVAQSVSHIYMAMRDKDLDAILAS